MPREHKISIYRFEELSKKAKEQAIKNYREKGWGWGQHDSDALNDAFKDLLMDKGFDADVEVFWNLNYSQGDGVAFKGSVDVGKYIRAADLMSEYGFLVGKISAVVKQEGRYTHWNSMEVEVYEEETGQTLGPKDWHPVKSQASIESLIESFRQNLETDVKAISRELQKIGYAEIEYKDSDEYIIETIGANDWEFTADGKMWHG